MKIEEYHNVLSILKGIIKNSEYENHVFTVGGCVRDSLMNNHYIKDIDIVVDLPNGGIEFAEWLYKNNYLVRKPIIYPTYGTSMFSLAILPDIELEAVETRKEQYKDKSSRNPEVKYGSLQEDCMRRDLTINALYYDITNDNVIDLINGVNDINNHIIQTPSDPDIIFDDDPLRMLRVCRFSARYGWGIQEKTLNSIKKNAHRIKIITQERITDEMIKSLTTAKQAGELFKLWKECGLTDYILYISDDNDILISQLNILSNNYGTAEQYFAALFHNHLDLLSNMKLSNDFIYTVNKLDESLVFVDTKITDYSVRKFGLFNGKDYRICISYLASWCLTPQIHKLKWFNDFFKKSLILESGNTMFDDSTKLPINGNDIMKYFNINPSKKVHEYLDYAWDYYCKNPNIGKGEILDALKNELFDKNL